MPDAESSGKTSKWLQRAVPLLIGFAIAAGVFWKIGVSEVAAALARAQPGPVLLGIGVYSVFVFLKMVRWSILSPGVPRLTAFRVYLIGQAVNQVAPTGAGELTRIYIGKTREIPVKETLTGVVVERLADTGVLLVFAALLLTQVLPPGAAALQLVIPAAALSLGFLFVLRPALVDTAVSLLEKIVRTPRVRKLRELRKALETLRSRRHLLLATLLLTIGPWLIYTAAVALFLQSMNIGIYLPTIVIVSLAVEIIGAFSFLPGGLGVKEGGFAFLLNLTAGLPLPDGLAVYIINRGVTYGILMGGALVSLATLRRAAPMEAAGAVQGGR
ncbi:MAG: flippase-like domain-containing protein [Euryarchaeota archaeon]|nr:flippase-like domain-containing protein [Euryarchaeota archaeon]